MADSKTKTMNFVKETRNLILLMILLLYVLFSFGNGNFDFTEWPQRARDMMAGFGGLLSVGIIVIQMVRAHGQGKL